MPAPGPPAPGQQLAIHTRGEHVDRPHVATNVRSGRRFAPQNNVRSQRYAPYSRAPPNHQAAHPGAGYTPHAVTAPASRMDFVQPQQQQYQQYQHYPQHQFGNVLPDADLMRFPSNSSQGTLGHGPLNAMGHQPSGNIFQEEFLRAEDFESAGLNLDAFQNEELDLSWDMAPLEPSDGSYSLDQMASRPIFHRYPAPASAPGYQQPLPEPTHAGYNVAGAYQSPYGPTMYAPQQAYSQPTFQPGPMYTPGSVENNFVEQPGPMYAPGYVENFVVQQPRPTARPRGEATYPPVSYATTEKWVEAQRRQPRAPSGE